MLFVKCVKKGKLIIKLFVQLYVNRKIIVSDRKGIIKEYYLGGGEGV